MIKSGVKMFVQGGIINHSAKQHPMSSHVQKPDEKPNIGQYIAPGGTTRTGALLPPMSLDTIALRPVNIALGPLPDVEAANLPGCRVMRKLTFGLLWA